MKEHEKLQGYKGLKKKSCGVEASVMPLAMQALSAVTSNLEKVAPAAPRNNHKDVCPEENRY